MARWIIAGMMLCGMTLAWPAGAQTAPGAGAVVERLQAGLIKSMQAGAAQSYPERFKQLKPLVLASHRMEASARLALGRHWQGLDARQRTRFTDTFTTLSIALYASNFNQYSGEKFKAGATQKLPNGQMDVRSVLSRRGEKDIQFDYVLDEQEGQFKIINIVVDGVSDLSLKRAEYSSVIEKEGFDALIRKLENKIAEYQNKANK